jgi:hypothetical protein
MIPAPEFDSEMTYSDKWRTGGRTENDSSFVWTPTRIYIVESWGHNYPIATALA